MLGHRKPQFWGSHHLKLCCYYSHNKDKDKDNDKDSNKDQDKDSNKDKDLSPPETLLQVFAQQREKADASNSKADWR